MSNSYVDHKATTVREGEVDGDVTSKRAKEQPSTRSVPGSPWSHRRLALVVVVGLAVAGGLLSAWLTPRGPITSGEALLLEQPSGSNESVETVEYRNDNFGFTISFPALFADLTTAREFHRVIYFVDSDIQQTHPDQPFGVVGRIEIFAKAETSAEDLQALGEIYGLRYLAENDAYFFGWAHATDVQLPPGADTSLVEHHRSLEAMFGDSMDSFKLVAATE